MKKILPILPACIYLFACASEGEVDVKQLLKDCNASLNVSSEVTANEGEQAMNEMIGGFLEATCDALKEECTKDPSGKKCKAFAKALRAELAK